MPLPVRRLFCLDNFALFPYDESIRTGRPRAARPSSIKEDVTMRIIGVTPTLSDTTGNITINQDYLDMVFRAGALPVLLPLTGDRAAMDAMLARIDGLILTGGADVSPERYGEEKLPCCGETAPRRDEMEFYLCRRAVEMDLPVLAICRGLQVLNCALGGTLYQDIASQYGDQLKHPCYDTPRDQVHAVRVEKGTKLLAAAGMENLRVNSRHHQAVKRLAPGLIVNARAEDGLIEGAEMPDKKFVVGVQWHPESLSDYAPEAQALMTAFAAACGGTI